jgi:hypothetical protein
VQNLGAALVLFAEALNSGSEAENYIIRERWEGVHAPPANCASVWELSHLKPFSLFGSEATPTVRSRQLRFPKKWPPNRSRAAKHPDEEC